MTRSCLLACLLLAACGRVGFDAQTTSDATDATDPDAVDAPPPGCFFTAVPVYVQGACDTNVNMGTTAVFSVAFPTPVIAGHVLVVAVDWDGVMLTPTITDSLGNLFQAVTPVVRSTTQSGQTFDAPVTVGGTDTVTVTLTGAAAGISFFLHEYSGISFTSTVDTFMSGTGNSMAMTSGVAAISVPGDLLFAHGVSMDVVTTPGPGFTQRLMCNQNMTEDRLAGAPGNYSAEFTSQLVRPWLTTVSAFRPATCP